MQVVGATVQVGERQGTVEIWSGDERIAVHPRAQQPKERFILPGQWSGLPRGDNRSRKKAVAVQIPPGEVERRSLEVYELVAGGCGMIALEQARQYLETLGLKQAVEVLENTLDSAANRRLPYPEMLAELLGVEVAVRRERYITTRTRLAHLPFQRTFEQFDFAFQPSIDERLVKELSNLAFVAEASNVLLLGPPGVGKTHLAIALALRARAPTSSGPTT